MENEMRLVDANALPIKFDGHTVSVWKCDLDAAPTVDAVEVVHGHWINGYNVDSKGGIVEHTIDCSVCDSVFKDKSREVVEYWKEQFKVCPFCGAKMDSENHEN